MRVLIACEFSGRVRNAFLDKGHDAYSCDLVPTSLEPKDRHIIGDVTPLLRKRWDLVIAHPPCTYLCLSGVCWLYKEPGRMRKMIQAANFFKLCLNANADRVCVENPIQHRHAKIQIGQGPSQRFQPWQFGHNESKKTCLWLKGLPYLRSTVLTRPSVIGQSINNEPPSKYRPYIRSITPQAVADVMAEQWG